ncbi:MAG: ECF transporter S component [Armatimonadota bacterium]|nr:ECF transporter S component [Armatimonadota bacterium]MDR7400684.1 ECF transporter S component [Armatimonadota bacterium]MDR7403617.1 ECF transporter S component [Armatimonadota bacterium]MDR7436505.1 ECF transporter S component [Armatimonadota bacterium]MDR7472540.1 ECF transporter S component [Armatimonadota bacterium]
MSTRQIARGALLIALVAAATLAVRIPVPATQGYINLGDSMVYVSALLFGPLAGALAGGVGSALADVIGGYVRFAPFTLVIKGLEGLVVGWLARRLAGRLASAADLAGAAAAVVAGGTLMVAGYFVTEAYVMGLGSAAAAAEVPGNVFQVVGGLVAALPVSVALRRLVTSTP